MYGFGYWLPELLSRFQLHASAHPDDRKYVCEVLSAQMGSNTTLEVGHEVGLGLPGLGPPGYPCRALRAPTTIITPPSPSPPA